MKENKDTNQQACFVNHSQITGKHCLDVHYLDNNMFQFLTKIFQQTDTCNVSLYMDMHSMPPLQPLMLSLVKFLLSTRVNGFLHGKFFVYIVLVRQAHLYMVR